MNQIKLIKDALSGNYLEFAQSIDHKLRKETNYNLYFNYNIFEEENFEFILEIPSIRGMDEKHISLNPLEILEGDEREECVLDKLYNIIISKSLLHLSPYLI